MARPSATVADHFHSPRNAGAMEFPDAVGKSSLGGRAPYVTIFIAMEGATVGRAMFQTFGCGFSIAACSALTELAIGASRDECRAMSAETLLSHLDGVPPAKRFCAQLAIDALHDALSKLRDHGGADA